MIGSMRGINSLGSYFYRNRFCSLRFCQKLSISAKKLELPPHSLYFNRSLEVVRPELKESYLVQAVLALLGYYTKQSEFRRGAGNLFKAVVEKANESAFYHAMNLNFDFPGEQAVRSLHVWLLIRRLDNEGDGKKVAQVFYEFFLEDVEVRLAKTGVKVRFNSLLVDLEKRFYGSCIAYDEALQNNAKESLAKALIRNVYQRDESKLESAERLERYLKREIDCLKLTDLAFVVEGKIKFTPFV